MKKLILLYYILFAAGLSYAQSLTPTENYVYTRTYLEPVTSETPSARQMQSVQYFDGLGRPKQGVSIQSTVTGKDLVLPIEYDSSGRQTKSYLPVPVSSLNGALQNTDGNAANAYYGTANAYSETLVEKSPLGRVLKQAYPGEDWAMTTDHTLKYEYGTNAAGVVKKFKVTTTWNPAHLIDDVSIDFAPDDNFTAGNYYKANTLDKKISKNEDNRETQIFTNSLGQTLLIRRVNKTDAGTPQYTDTYYVYDDYGNLVLVIPPKAAGFNTIAELNAQMDGLCYQYRYDKYNRTVEKKIPGKGWEFLVYDQQNRLVGSQDAELRKKGQWMYTKYDQLGRVAFTGIFSGTTRASQQAWADSFGANNVKRTTNVFFNREGMDVFYDPNGTYPTTDWVKMLSVNYYDTYPSGSPAVPDKILEQATLSAAPLSITSNGYTTVRSIKSLPTASHTKNLEDDSWTSSFIWYDTQGSAVGTYGKNHLGGSTRTETELDFSGVAKRSIVYHKRLDTDAETVIKQRSVYDRNNVLQKQYHQVNSQPEELLVENTYNDIGQLISKKVGNNLQTVDYRYNIRGWLTKINDPVNLNGKLFGYEVKYTNPVYSNIASGNFDGTVSEIDWKTADNNVQKRYTYGYDALNRLKDAIYTEPNSTTPYNNNYNENVTYDLNGNIATLKRNAFPLFGTTSTQVDDLVYQYTGNRLDKVIENSLNDTGYEGGNNAIDYDLNGNMINMKDKGIQTINYNILDLPNTYDIVQTTLGSTVRSTLSYLYRADGTKLRKTITGKRDGKGTSMTTRMTDYLDSFQYSYTDRGGFQPCLTCRTETAFEEQAYKNVNDFTGSEVLPEWKLDIVPTAEGFYSFTENRYIYQYEDHLGNARVSFAKNSAGAPEILDTNNYYPFGLNHIGGNGLNSSGFGSWQSYKYNGKELQETGMYDYGARFYMADLGRWGVIDPLAEQSRRWSPYHYAAGNPVNFIDPDGRIALKVNYADQVIGGVDENYLATSQWNSERGPTSLGSYAGYDSSGSGLDDDMEVYEGDAAIAAFKALTNTQPDFSKFDFSNLGIKGPGDDKLSLNDRIGDKVLPAKETVLGKIWATLEPREWKDSNGRTYRVGSDGKIIGIGLITGTVPLGSGGVFKGAGFLKKLPSIDGTRKVHGALPRVKDLPKFSKDELRILVQELKISVQQRIKVTSKLGRDASHGERQGAEQNLINYIEKYLNK